MKVIDGEYSKRLIWIRLNIINPNPVATEIAYKELRSIADACGKPEVQDTEELHMIPFRALVDISPASASFPESNTIKKYEAMEGTAAAAAETGSNPFADEEG